MEAVKPLKLNSTNNKILAGFAKQDGLIGKECHVIENWAGMKIELFVDRNVKMMGSLVDGIRIKPLRPKEKVKKEFTEANFEGALKVKATREQIEKNYTITDEIWKQYSELL